MTSPNDSAIMSSLHDDTVIDFGDIRDNIENNNHTEFIKINQINFDNKYNIISTIILLSFTLIDLFIAYSDKKCVYIYDSNLNLNLQMYLIIYDYLTLLNIICKLAIFNFVEMNKCSKHTIFINSVYTAIIIIDMFIFVWNIFGLYIFIKKIYHDNNGNNCNIFVYDYLFCSIILKIVMSVTFHIKRIIA